MDLDSEYQEGGRRSGSENALLLPGLAVAKKGISLMIYCPRCGTGFLSHSAEKVTDRYDYLILHCHAENCGHQTAIQVVQLKHLDPVGYDRMVREGLIDPRYNVVRQPLAA
jgi:hypothetical protein